MIKEILSFLLLLCAIYLDIYNNEVYFGCKYRSSDSIKVLEMYLL